MFTLCKIVDIAINVLIRLAESANKLMRDAFRDPFIAHLQKLFLSYSLRGIIITAPKKETSPWLHLQVESACRDVKPSLHYC